MSTLSFNEMLDNIYSSINTTEKKKMLLPDLVVERISTKLLWKNIKQILRILNRSPDNFYVFIKNDWNVYWKSESISDGLIIDCKVNKQKIISLLNRYIKSNVICNSCKSHNTIIIRNKKIDMLVCNDCRSSYSVS